MFILNNKMPPDFRQQQYPPMNIVWKGLQCQYEKPEASERNVLDVFSPMGYNAWNRP